MQEVVGSNPTEGKIRISQFTLFYRVECKKLFCKTNIKLKVLKLNKRYLKLFEMFEFLISYKLIKYFKNSYIF